MILLENAPPSPLDEYTKNCQTVYSLTGGGAGGVGGGVWFMICELYLNLKENKLNKSQEIK